MTAPIERMITCLRHESHIVTNFDQTLWIEQGVGMNCLAEGSADLATRTFAINILALILPGAAIRLARGNCSPAAYSLHIRFADDVLADMPSDGGNILLSELNQWIEENLCLTQMADAV